MVWALSAPDLLLAIPRDVQGIFQPNKREGLQSEAESASAQVRLALLGTGILNGGKDERVIVASSVMACSGVCLVCCPSSWIQNVFST